MAGPASPLVPPPDTPTRHPACRIWLPVLTAALIACATPAAGASLTLAWDPNTEANLGGYILAYGTTQGTYPNRIDVGTQTFAEVTELVERQAYYFVVYAYSTSGVLSRPSDEVVGVVLDECTYGLSSSTFTFDAAGGTQGLSVFASPGCAWTAAATAPWLTLGGVSGGRGGHAPTLGRGSRALTLTAASYRGSTSARFAGVRIGGAQPLAIVVVQTPPTSSPAIDRPTRSGPSPLSLWRLAGGTWYLDQQGYGLSAWSAIKGDGRWLAGQPVPGDYDGDGAGDYAVWRSHDGVWLIRLASSAFADLRQVPWGQQGDVPVPADYDGDGRSDLAVWRPATGTWHVKTSASDYRAHLALQWGIASLGDQPAAGDYDGDGRADLAVWRSTTGVWHILRSRAAYSHTHAFTGQLGVGALGDEPIVGDFDGDGTADLAIWRHDSDPAWYALLSGQGLSGEHFRVVRVGPPAAPRGPTMTDVDGDGRSDVAVWDDVLASP